MNITQHLIPSCLLLAALGPAAKAQDAVDPAAPAIDAAPKKSTERIQVTGSRLKKIDAEGANPVTIIGKEQIEKTGAVSVRDLLQGFAGTTAAFSGGGASVAGGVATVSLKGLGPARTLVLVDGVRLPKHPSLAAVDLNTIPVAAIERVEVLRQSASAIYGADAVGGVINIITRKNYTGSQVQVQAKQPMHKGGDSQSISASTGFGEGAASSVLILSYDRQSLLGAKDRAFSRDRVSNTGYPGTYAASIARPDANNLPVTARETYPVVGCPNYVEAGGQVQQAPGCDFNYNSFNSLLPKMERVSGLYNFTYELPNNQTFTAKLIASHQKSESQLRPEGSVGRDLKATIDQGVIDSMDAARFNTLFPGFGGLRPAAGGVKLNLRFVDFGNTITKKEANLVGATSGLEGSWSNGWDWKVLLNGAGTSTSSNSRPKLLLAATDAALAQGELIPWDPNFDRASISERLVRHSSYLEKSTTYGVETLINGDIGTLNDKAVAVAFGVSAQNEDYDVKWNRDSTEGLLLNVAGAPGKGEREVVSATAEISATILPAVEADLAARVDQYSDFGSAFNPQLSLSYIPFSFLKFRSSVGTAFKAPSLDEMHGASGVSYNTVVDYDYCTRKGISRTDCPNDKIAATNVKNVRTSNPDLEPEKSDIYAFGLVVQPTPTLTLTADYWKIRSRDLVDYRDLQDLVDENDSAVRRSDDADRIIEYIELPIQNLSKTTRSGLDAGLDFNQSLGTVRFTYQALGTWYFEDKLQPKGKPEQNNLGTNGSYKWKLNNSLDFALPANYGVTLIANTIGTHGKSTDDSQRLPQYTRYDVQGRYAGAWNGEIAVGVVNLLDKQGGVDDTLLGDVESSIYDIKGREYYLRLTQNF